MDIDLAFVQFDMHRRLLREVLDEALGDEEVIGVLLAGSVARGDAYPGSDLDVYVLLRDGCHRPLHSEVRHGIVVERAYADFALAREKLERNPMRVYVYLDGRVLYDPQRRLGQLVALARARMERYCVTAKKKRDLAYWLESARCKMIAAQEAGDLLQAAYVASTTSWPILEGLWAANDMPMPPNGAVRAHIWTLAHQPPDMEALWHKLFVGDAHDRVQAAIAFIEWIVAVLDTDLE